MKQLKERKMMGTVQIMIMCFFVRTKAVKANKKSSKTDIFGLTHNPNENLIFFQNNILWTYYTESAIFPAISQFKNRHSCHARILA